jgi:hypothetical protein
LSTGGFHPYTHVSTLVAQYRAWVQAWCRMFYFRWRCLDFSFHHHIRNGVRTNTASHLMGSGGSLPTIQTDHSLSCNADVSNAWNFTSTTHISFMASCLDRSRTWHFFTIHIRTKSLYVVFVIHSTLCQPCEASLHISKHGVLGFFRPEPSLEQLGCLLWNDAHFLLFPTIHFSFGNFSYFYLFIFYFVFVMLVEMAKR